MRSTRYCDIDFSSESERTSSTTRRAKRARLSAAWPAELAAPTMYTSSPSHARASLARRAVVHAAPGELREPGRVEQPVRHAGGDEHRAGLDLAAVAEADRPHRAARLEADDVAGEHHLGAEPARLGDGPVREVGARQALREAEVVLDRRALPGLAARRLAFDDDGLQPLRRAVHRGREPGRPAADDAEVVQRLLGAGAQAERVGELDGRRRRAACSPSGTSTSGRSAAPGLRELVQPLRLVVALEVEPAVRHVVAGEERLDLVAALRPAVADDAHAAELVDVRVAASRSAGRRAPGRGAPRAGPTA